MIYEKLYSYVLRYDRGFAPNPFFGYCTLACCKSKIRKKARAGDWIVGTGSVKNVGNDKIIYAMKVTEVVDFEEYDKDPRFKRKIPHKGIKGERGDNIYFKDKDGKWRQRYPSYHSDESRENKEKKEDDLKYKHVLISKHFVYFGKNAKKLPPKIKGIVKKGPNYKCNFPSELIKKFVKWAEKEIAEGRVQGNPNDFKTKIECRSC